MPIVIPCAQGDPPLAQGDLLSSGAIYSAAVEANGEPEAKEFPYLMVVSRDCSALRKKTVVVAPVAEMASEPNFRGKQMKDLSFEEAKEYLEQMREGVTRPDRFYLGNLPGGTKRFWAHLDELGTQAIPEVAEARAEWVRARRVGRLDEDFIRALPVRLFGSVARIGFHDYEWWADQDLRWLVHTINAAIGKEEGELERARAVVLAPPGEGREAGAERNVANRTANLESHLRDFAPYIKELERREASQARG